MDSCIFRHWFLSIFCHVFDALSNGIKVFYICRLWLWGNFWARFVPFSAADGVTTLLYSWFVICAWQWNTGNKNRDFIKHGNSKCPYFPPFSGNITYEDHHVETFLLNTYSGTRNASTMNKARRTSFTETIKSIENLSSVSPTSSQYIKKSKIPMFSYQYFSPLSLYKIYFKYFSKRLQWTGKADKESR